MKRKASPTTAIVIIFRSEKRQANDNLILVLEFIQKNLNYPVYILEVGKKQQFDLPVSHLNCVHDFYVEAKHQDKLGYYQNCIIRKIEEPVIIFWNPNEIYNPTYLQQVVELVEKKEFQAIIPSHKYAFVISEQLRINLVNSLEIDTLEEHMTEMQELSPLLMENSLAIINKFAYFYHNKRQANDQEMDSSVQLIANHMETSGFKIARFNHAIYQFKKEANCFNKGKGATLPKNKKSLQQSDTACNLFSKNILLITLDSLRYDTAMLANTPNFDQLFEQTGLHNWRKSYSQSTFTLASHISMFHAGLLPEDKHSYEPLINRKVLGTFRPTLQWNRNQRVAFPTQDAPNIVKGFSNLGYHTIGIGGVGWFNTKFQSSSLWHYYFDEFHWNESFHEANPRALEKQLALAKQLQNKYNDRSLFFFINVSSTHSPFCGFGNSIKGQAKALEYVDKHLVDFILAFPRPNHVIVTADHGECFGEDQLWGHGFYHPKVMEVPIVHLDLR